MNRWEFMKELDNLLADIPEEERKEALNYYNDYFDDAGVENTAHVISELGSPSEVAAQIRAEFATALQPIAGTARTTEQTTEQAAEAGEYTTEPEWKSYNTEEQKTAESSTAGYTYSNAKEASGAEEKKKLSTGWIVAIVILCILASPALLGAAGSIFGIVVAIIAVIFSMIATFGALTIAFILVGIVLFIGGIANCFANPMGGITAMGLGAIFAALGVVFLMLTVLLAGVMVPAICKGIYSLFKKIRK